MNDRQQDRRPPPRDDRREPEQGRRMTVAEQAKAEAAERQKANLARLDDALRSKTSLAQFEAALPKHITPQQFARVLFTAIQKNPMLMMADPRRLMLAATMAAADGLLPDGRQGALVPFKNNDLQLYDVQWMPMVGGLIDLVYGARDAEGKPLVKLVTHRVIYASDEFDASESSEGEQFFYRKNTNRPAGDKPVGAYCAIRMREGGVIFEHMDLAQIDKVRKSSRTKGGSGPWVDHWDEMARKTVFRRAAKRLPRDAGVHEVLNRDETIIEGEMVDSSRVIEAPRKGPQPASSQRIGAGLAALANDAPAPMEDPQDEGYAQQEDERQEERAPVQQRRAAAPRQEAREDRQPDEDRRPAAREPAQRQQRAPARQPEPAPAKDETASEAYLAGVQAYEDGVAISDIPPEFTSDQDVTDFQQGYEDAEREAEGASA